jgi:AcrR family transcriptional regulator
MTSYGMNARDHLLLTAQKVFNDFGYRRASMGDVSKAAGVSRQGLYHHFRNKPELFTAVIEKAHINTVDKSAQARDAARARGDDFESIVAAMIDERFGQMLRDLQKTPHRGEIFEETMRRCPHVVLEQTRRFHNLMTELIHAEVAAGRMKLLPEISADELAIAFATMARGLSLLQPDDLAHLRERYLLHIRLLTRGARA